MPDFPSVLTFNRLGINEAVPATAGMISAQLGANGITGFRIRAFAGATTGNFLDFQTAAGASLLAVAVSGQLVSAVVTGTAPFSVASATQVANLYAARAALGDTVTTNANLTGPITSAGNVTTITAGVVTNAMLANVGTATFKGRTTAATGVPEDLTGTQATAMLNLFSATLQGLAPLSGGGTTNFLRADGTWTTPAGGGTVTSSGTPLVNQLAVFTTATDIKGVAVGATGTVLTGVSAANPAWSASPSLTTIITSAQGNRLGSAAGSSSLPTASNTNLLLYNNSASNWSGIGADVTGDMYFVTGTSGTPSSRMRIDTVGNVSIKGTSTNGLITPLTIENPSGDAATTEVRLSFLLSGAVYGYITTKYASGAPYMAFGPNNIEAMRLAAGMQIGAPTGGDKGAGTLNTAGDQYKNGTAYTNPKWAFRHFYAGVCDTSGPYAAPAGYGGLIDLDRHETFVRQNHDLPLMVLLPDAGIFGRGDLLLASLEEAYLYIYQLHRRIAALEARR